MLLERVARPFSSISTSRSLNTFARARGRANFTPIWVAFLPSKCASVWPSQRLAILTPRQQVGGPPNRPLIWLLAHSLAHSTRWWPGAADEDEDDEYESKLISHRHRHSQEAGTLIKNRVAFSARRFVCETKAPFFSSQVESSAATRKQEELLPDCRRVAVQYGTPVLVTFGSRWSA